MKKLLLILMLMSGPVFAQNVKIASPSTPAQNILSGVTVNNSTNVVIPGSLTVSNEFTLPKSAVTFFVWTCTNANGHGTWMASTSTNTLSQEFVMTNNALFVNAITNVTSVGSGDSLRSAVSNNIFFIKSITGTSGVTVSATAQTLTISGSGSGGPSSILSTNLTTSSTGPNIYTWVNILQLTTTATTGNVFVQGRAMTTIDPPATLAVRIRDVDTNVVFNSHNNAGTLQNAPALTTCDLVDTLSGSTKTYYMDVFSGTLNQALTNTITGAQTAQMTNGLGMFIIQMP